MTKHLVLLGVLPLVILAQELEKITIEALSDTKQSIKEESFYRTYTQDTISKDDIEKSVASDIKDALSHIPGVQVKETGSFTKNLKIRGLGGDRVISIVDGMKLANQGVTHSGGGELGLVDLSTVETIELIKGSPAVVYDPGATGGIIKVTTVKDISKIKDGVGAKYTYGYDDGYLLNTHSLFLEGKYKNFYTSLTGTTKDSKGRNVKDEKKVADIIAETNINEERFDSEFEIKNLGYDSNSYQFFSSYQLHDKATVFIKKSDYQADDLSFTHGGQNAMVFHYDEYARESESIGIEAKNLVFLDRIDASYSHQIIRRMNQVNIFSQNVVRVETDTFKIDAKKYFDAHEVLFGMESSKDKAKTYIYSDQEYIASYLNGIYNHDKFTLSSGARFNYYKVQQHIQEGRNLDVIYDLIGISGILKDSIDDIGWSYAAGATYLINDNNNLSLNYSKTYRYPSLYERFAYDTFLGGGADMEAEKGNNFEFSYKYLDDTLSLTATIFHTDFDTYNNFYKFVQIKNQNYLNECNSDPECDPFDGGDNEREIFTTFLKHASFKNVKNSGFEFTLVKLYKEQNLETNFNIALNKFTDQKVLLAGAKEPLIVSFKQDPLEFSAYIKKDFKNAYAPWVKFKIRHVTNKPKVKQIEGFSSFTTADLYFGGKYNNYTLNAGIRNLSDEVYHEPYMGLDGLKRTFYMTVSAKF